MKTKLFLLLTLIGIGFSSCDSTSDLNYTPKISIYSRLLVYKADKLIGKDTLDIYRTELSDEFLIDTITVGDTVILPITFDGITSNLTSFYLVQSADSLTSIVVPQDSLMDDIFLPTSNYAEGKFITNGSFSYLFFPFRYIAKKPSKDAKITISVTSDAVFKDLTGSNTKTLVLKTPIVKAK